MHAENVKKTINRVRRTKKSVKRFASTSVAAVVMGVVVATGAARADDLITPVNVTAQSWYTSDNRAPVTTIDGSGMTPNTPVTTNSTAGIATGSAMWLSNGTRSTWITFDLGAVQTLTGFHLWNYNETGNYSQRGIKTAGLYIGTSLPTNYTSYAESGSAWGTLVTNMTFYQASGAAGNAGRYYSFANTVTTRYVQVYVTANWSASDAYTGLSEIRFFAATARSAGDQCVSPSAATAKSYYGNDNRAPVTAINGSGMTPSGTPLLATATAGNTPANAMWLDNTTNKSWITFDLGTVQKCTGIRLWNYNEHSGNPALYTAEGVKMASVYVGNSLPTNGTPYTACGGAWGSWVQDFRFSQANGSASLGGVDYPFGNPVTGRYIQLYITDSFGVNLAGLSEVMFYTDTRYEAVSPIAATAESFFASVSDIRSPDRAIDGSDMTPNNPLTTVSTSGNAYVSVVWLSNNRTNTWITFDLGAEQTVAGFRLWNYNEVSYPGRGVKTADIYVGTSLPTNGTPYAESGAAWGTLVTNMTFAQGTGLTGLVGSDYGFASPVTTRYVQIYVTDNWSATELYTGIGEIMFYTAMTDLTRRDSGAKVLGNGVTKSVRIVEGTGTPGAITLEASTTTNSILYVAKTEGTATIDPAGNTLVVSKIQLQQDAGSLTLGTGSNNGTLKSRGTAIIVDNPSTNSVTVHSVIANGTAASALTKSGAGSLILTAANTYSGSTTVNAGTLLLASGSISNASVTVNGGTTLQVSGGSVNTPAVTLANAMLKLDGGAVATVGQTLLNTAAVESTLRFDNGTLSVHPGQPGLAAADWIGAGTAVKIADGGATLNTANGSATLNRSLLQLGSSTGGLTKAGANTLTLTAPATYAGRTVVQGGTLKLMPPAPIIYYDFDTTSISGTTLLNRGTGGAAYNGVIAGSPATGVGGKAGEALVFSATGQGVTTANSVSLVNGFSYAAWVKSSGPTNLPQRIINNYFAAGGYLGTGSDNKFNAYIAGNKCVYAPASDDTANWHHVALVWDGLRTVFFYDGVGIQTNTLSGVNAAYNSKIGFGNNPVPNHEFWNGALDEAYVFDRALTAAEVAGLKEKSWANVSLLQATTSLELNNNAILELNGISQTVTTLTLNNVLKARGDCTWGAAGSGAMYTSSQFSGTGVLRVLGPAAPATMISFF